MNLKNDGSKRPPAYQGEEIGYCKPPTRRRFKKSGNPNGRPKGSKNRKMIIKEIANEMHNVGQDGQRQSILNLVLRQLRNMALGGKNDRAFAEYHRLLQAYQPEVVGGDAGCLVAPAELTPEEWIMEQTIRNKMLLLQHDNDDG
ncbi:MAG: hypothetical protein HQ501_03475 [Rhodospirillales bacterium]|nr:hypothetical protein [Rhodospirillales bacterium]